MDLVIFKFLGRLLRRTRAGPMKVRRTRHLAPKTMPMLAVRKTRSARSAGRRRTSSRPELGRNSIASARMNRMAKTKKPPEALEPSQTSNIPTATIASFDTCPSCGLQAPGSLLAEHFLGSPSHKNGPPKIVKAETVETENSEDTKEDDSKQSVRNLLQMLVPPRAFGHRHSHRSMGPISSIVKDLAPSHRRLP